MVLCGTLCTRTSAILYSPHSHIHITHNTQQGYRHALCTPATRHWGQSAAAAAAPPHLTSNNGTFRCIYVHIYKPLSAASSSSFAWLLVLMLNRRALMCFFFCLSFFVCKFFFLYTNSKKLLFSFEILTFCFATTLLITTHTHTLTFFDFVWFAYLFLITFNLL